MQEFIVKYWLEVIFGIVVTMFGCGYKKLENRVKEQEAMRGGIIALLWDRLYQIHGHQTDKGFITVDELRNVEIIYTQYHILGGNGTGTELYDRLKSLPIGD